MFLVLEDLVLSARVGGTGLSVPLMMSAERGLRLWKLSLYRTESFDGIVKNKLPGKLFFFDQNTVPLWRTYVLCTQGRRNISLIGWTAVGSLSVFEWAETCHPIS